MTDRPTGDVLSPGIRLWAMSATVAVPLLLRVMSFERLAGMLEPGRPRLGDQSAGFDDAHLAARVDEWLHRLGGPWSHTCLKRAATLFYLLRAAGRPVGLRIGVRRGADQGLEAHAWLTLAGETYLEADPSLPAAHEPIAAFPEEA